MPEQQRARAIIHTAAIRALAESGHTIIPLGGWSAIEDRVLTALSENGLAVVDRQEFTRLLDDHAELSKFISPEYGTNVRARLRAALETEKPSVRWQDPDSPAGSTASPGWTQTATPDGFPILWKIADNGDALIAARLTAPDTEEKPNA